MSEGRYCNGEMMKSIEIKTTMNAIYLLTQIHFLTRNRTQIREKVRR